ncbi:MAG: hypothetical protein LLG00_11245 [Planctomycetaceae bacterium]|nr:hypothetical protein [Planctomycetaceae bacterium]
MKRLNVVLVAILFAAFVGILGACATEAQAARPAPKGSGPAPKSERYIVVQIGDEFEVMTPSELKTRRASLKEQYKQELNKYNQDKKDAAKKKEKFEGAKPVELKPKQLGPTFKTKEEAETFCEKKRQDKNEGKGDKKPALK